MKAAEGRVARVVLFNYDAGKATRLLVDASSGEILTEELMRGRPQPSEEEIQEAFKIIRQDRELSRALQENGAPESGFVVDGPPGAPSLHRFIQIQLLSPDRLRLRRVVVVDLTAGTIVSSKANY